VASDRYSGRGISPLEALEHVFTGVLLLPFVVLIGVFALGLIVTSIRFAITGSPKLARRAMGFFVLSVLLLASLILMPVRRVREKPVIYLYSETAREVTVRVDFPGELGCTYPEHGQDGWRVMTGPDGSLVNVDTGRRHYCLYWEGKDDLPVDFSSGFVVKGEETSSFLETALERLGLTECEANEFIIYWLPRMKKNRYNLVHFQTDEYAKRVPLHVDPKPDTVIRIFMVFKPCPADTQIPPQIFEKPERHGLTLVEWGGTEL
jgi:hypothetical protein